MKTLNSHSPGIVCRMVRLWSTFASRHSIDGDGDDRISRHVADCRSCRAYFQAGDSLEARLRRDARALQQQVPAGLEDRIFESIEIRNHAPVRSTNGTRLLVFSLAGAAAVIAVSFVLLRDPTTTPTMANIETPIPVESSEFISVTAVAAIDAVPRGMRNLVGTSSTALSEQNPLQQEMGAVYSDSRSVLRFLARNFLAEVPEALNEDPATPTT